MMGWELLWEWWPGRSPLALRRMSIVSTFREVAEVHVSMKVALLRINAPHRYAVEAASLVSAEAVAQAWPDRPDREDEPDPYKAAHAEWYADWRAQQ